MMDKKQALQKVFGRSSKLVKVLELHRDGFCCCEEKADMLGKGMQHIKNQQSKIIQMFGVNNMNEAVEQAIHYEIILPNPKLQPVFSNKWSELLRHYHRNYINTLTREQKKQLGIVEE